MDGPMKVVLGVVKCGNNHVNSIVTPRFEYFQTLNVGCIICIIYPIDFRVDILLEINF
jgi:hypothetical protein